MKAAGYNFLVRANIRRGKRSNSVFALQLLAVLSLLLVTSYSFTLNQVMNSFKNQDPARRLSINSSFVELGKKVLTNELLEQIEQLDYVDSVDVDSMQYEFFEMTEIQDEKGNCKEMLPAGINNSLIEVRSLYKTQQMDVISGKTLQESPAFSCLVPSTFYPVKDYDTGKNEYNLQEGASYLGKTFTLESSMGYFDVEYYKESGLGGYTNDWYHLPSVKCNLKVVGVYYTSYDGMGDPNKVYISDETGQKMQEMAVKATNDEDFIQEYKENLKKPELHSYTVLVDDSKHVEQVRQAMEDMGISVFSSTMQSVPDDVGLFATVFTAAGNFFTVAILLLTVINLFLATSNSLLERKGEIGLLKAVGYKNRQIFMSLYMEQMILGLRAFLIGGGISAAAVAVLNIINANGPFVNRIYVVKWPVFLLLAAAALFVTIAVPLICQLVLIRSMTKIEPREAMAAQ